MDCSETWQFLTLQSQVFPPSRLHHTLLPSALLPPELVKWRLRWTSKEQRREWRKWWRRERQTWRRNPQRCPSGWMMMIYPPWCETEPSACIFKIPLSYINNLHVLHSWSESGSGKSLCFVGIYRNGSRFLVHTYFGVWSVTLPQQFAVLIFPLFHSVLLLF